MNEMQINKTANGFLVRPSVNYSRGECHDLDSFHVFNHFDDMVRWVAKEFGVATALQHKVPSLGPTQSHITPVGGAVGAQGYKSQLAQAADLS